MPLIRVGRAFYIQSLTLTVWLCGCSVCESAEHIIWFNCIYIYIYIYILVYMCIIYIYILSIIIHVYIYIVLALLCTYIYIYIHISWYIYIYIYRERERDMSLHVYIARPRPARQNFIPAPGLLPPGCSLLSYSMLVCFLKAMINEKRQQLTT